MKWCSVTTVLIGICVAYIGHTVLTLYQLFHIAPCDSIEPGRCLHPWLFLKKSNSKYNHEDLAVSTTGYDK